jgi:hypothetical protein
MLKEIVTLLRKTPWDKLDEPDEIIERTEIDGLYWIRNHFLKTTHDSRIILPDPGQGNFTAVYHAADFSKEAHGGYEMFGIHVGQTDVLTFLATDDREMTGVFVDCRQSSPTWGKRVVLTWRPDPDRALHIDRGIAHLPDNVISMVTLNQPRLYWDFYNPQFDPNVDVVNVLRDAAPEDFPKIRVNRFRTPTWLCRQTLRMQRLQLRAGLVRKAHPYRFRIGDKTVTIVQKDDYVNVEKLAADLLQAEKESTGNRERSSASR